MRFGLPLFDADEVCLRYPQISDRYGHHCLTYIMLRKIGLYNCIRDEVCRFLFGGRFGLKIESLGFLPDKPDRRPADLLTIPSALCRQSSWHFLPRIAIDFTIISPFRMARGHLAREAIKTAQPSLPYKVPRASGFEPIIFEHTGEYNEEGKKILDSS